MWSPVDSAVPECRKTLRHSTGAPKPDLSRHGDFGMTAREMAALEKAQGPAKLF